MTTERIEAFLRSLAKGVGIGAAAKAVGVSRSTDYTWRSESPEFAMQWAEAVTDTIESLDSVIYRRAMAGDMKAARMWMEAHNREVYGRRMAVAVGGDDSAPPIGVAVGEGRRVFLPFNDLDNGDAVTIDA